MTPEHRLWLAIQRRVGERTPTMSKAMLDAFKLLTGSMTEAELVAALTNPDTFAETVISDARMRAAFAGVRTELHGEVRDATLWYRRFLPSGGIGVGFNVLDPRVIEAIRSLDSRVMRTLRDDMRDSVRVVVKEGIEAGLGPRTIARRVRNITGLAPNQLRAVNNFRAALEGGNFNKALGYKLRDKRFDRTLQRLLGTRGALTAEQVEKQVAAYRRKFLAWNAQTNARTAVNDAQRLGKHLATQAAIDAGLLDADRMRSRWVNSGDGRVREEHEDINGVVVRFGEPFPDTGTYNDQEVIPGEHTFNCRCIKFDYMVDNVESAPREVG